VVVRGNGSGVKIHVNLSWKQQLTKKKDIKVKQ